MKIAVLTMAYNEPVYLPIWARYYGQIVGAQNLFIIDHGSTDDCMSQLPRAANIIRVPRSDAFDEAPRAACVSSLQRALLQYYDAVIYGDCDELIVPDPEIYNSLHDAVSASPLLTAPIGLHLFHATDREGDLDYNRPILEQRRYCAFTQAMCKPIITKSCVEWSMGFHSANSRPYYSKDIYLFHLKAMDVKGSLLRHAQNQNNNWSEDSIIRNIGAHHRFDVQQFKSCFFDSYLHLLQTNENCEFNFSEEVEAVERDETGGHDRPAIRVAKIPDRFVGKF